MTPHAPGHDPHGAPGGTISSWSIRHPIPTIVLFLVLTAAGLLGYAQLRINNTPDIEIPVVTVTVAQPGAAPTELETQVTRLIEDAVAGLGDVDHVTSTVNDGVTTTVIEFQLGVDIDRVTNDVRNAVTSIRGDLPADVEEPIVQRIDTSGGAIVVYAVRSETLDAEALSWFVDNDVTKALLNIDGVSGVGRVGGVDREIRVKLDPERLMALGITAGDVSRQLRRENLNAPGGRTTLDGGEQSIRTLGSATTLEGLAATRITLANGRTVRLDELGGVVDQWAEPRQLARFDGAEIVAFQVTRTQGSSEVDVYEAVLARVAALDADTPQVTIDKITDTTSYVKEGYLAAVEALLLGAALAVVVVWWFLRDGRATFISAIAMPLSLIPTFAVMAMFDSPLSTVTLLALSLVVGILVDDAIVEVENIVRHMRMGKRPYQAAMEAADEIGLAVIATTFTIVAVFAPVAFMPGVAGQFFAQFALAACTAVLFSLVVARMLTPLMGAYLMKPQTKSAEEDEPFWMRPYLGTLGWALRHRWLSMGIATLFFIGSMYLGAIIPRDFVPATDRGRIALNVELPPGATLQETDAAAQRIAGILAARSEVASVYTAVGASTGGGMANLGRASGQGEVRRATVFANLIPRGQRDLSAQQLERIVAQEIAGVPGIRVRFGADGNSGTKVGVTLVSDNGAALQRASLELERQMRTIPRLTNVASTANLARPELHITPKPDKAAELGIASDAIATTARIATLGDTDAALPKFNLPDRQIPIRVMLEEAARGDLEVIRNLRVPAPGGTTVPLANVADFTLDSGPAQITRLDRLRSATVEAELGGLTLGEANALIRQLPIMGELPPGVREVSYGDTERFAELIGGFVVAFVSGILLVYVVLVLLFRGFLQPVTIMSALPLSFGGAFGFMLIMGKSLSIPAMIGILMLMGIAAKNSILLVEYAIMIRAQGLSRLEALMEAAHKRARPILMTTVAMSAGMLPIALGIGADAEFRSPMAVAVVGGLVSSTLLSLLFVPVAYTFADDVERWLGRRLRGLITHRHADANAGGAAAPGISPVVLTKPPLADAAE